MAAGKNDPLIPGSVTWRKAGDEAVILDMETSEYYSANDTGTFIWERLSAGEKAEAIAAALAAEYGISEDRAADDTRVFLKSLSKLKVVVPETEK